MEYSKNAIVDSDDEDVKDSGSTNVETQQDMLKSQLFRTPSPQLTTKPASSSPLRLSETIQDQSGEHPDTGKTGIESENSNEIDFSPNIVVGEGRQKIVNTDSFAQSKPDFTFSSPPTVTPEGGNSEGEDNHQTRQRESSPDPSEDLDISPSLEAQQQARGSFGSAGVIGFHEQMFGSLSLRNALMRHRPSSNFDVTELARDEKRPGTAV
ncbi:hypothetical protein K445DRAFT_315122 [Daldinia sp. EC12]|nr:hypothetical protein K445DRAFT_315122 [Daldinia sp. EC12]